MPTNKQLIFQALAIDPANNNFYFALNFVFNVATSSFDLFLSDQVSSDHVALASQVPGTGTPVAGGGGGAATVPGGATTQLQYNNAGAFGGVTGLTSDGTNIIAGAGNLRATSPRITTGILDLNGNEMISYTAVANAINEITISNNSIGASPIISATGGDTNINIILTPKGSGQVLFAPGAQATPGIAFNGAASTGFWNAGSTILISCAGIDVAQISGAAGGAIEVSSGVLIGWAQAGSVGTSIDVALGRNAAGAVEINTGVLGQFRDLFLRNLTLISGGFILFTSAGLITVASSVFSFANAGNSALISLKALHFIPGVNADVAIGRNAAGVIEVNSNVAGTYRDIRLRNLIDSNNAQIVTTQQGAVADAAGGATIDAEARTALNSLLAKLRTHGLIAP